MFLKFLASPMSIWWVHNSKVYSHGMVFLHRGLIIQAQRIKRSQVSLAFQVVQLHFIQCPFPNQIQFSLEKDTPKNCIRFSKPIPVWFGKKKIVFARRRFQTKFRLVWKILMTIVNVLKVPNQSQFGLEKSLTIANALNLEPIPVLFCKISF